MHRLAKLHVLHLLECVGPFTAAMLQPLQLTAAVGVAASQLDSSTQLPSPSPTAAPLSPPPPASTHRWTLSSLQLCGGPVLLRDADVKRLVGKRPGTLTAFGLSNAPLVTPGLIR